MKTILRGPIHGVPGANTVLVEGDTITWVGQGKAPSRANEEIIIGGDEIIAPGLIDLQVNGFGGFDAAEGATSIAAIAESLPPTGVTAFLPTLISSPVEVGAEFVAAAGAAGESDGARVLGAHLEGPFLNPSYRGVHALENLVEPTAEKVGLVLNARPRFVTIAPEQPGALAAIERLHRAGIVVSAGHSGADFEVGRSAIRAGVRFATHVYNAMTLMHHRRPGIALALLLDQRVTIGLIADREHVHAAVCEQVFRMVGARRIALTTDAVAAAGSPAGDYILSGLRVVSDGKTVRLPDGRLAGSAASMPDLLRVMARLPGVGVARALDLASAVPARVLGERSLGRIKAGACADLVVLDPDLQVRLTMIRGLIKFRR